MFQSLFLWNDLFNSSAISPPDMMYSCFNPCFYGTTSSTLCRGVFCNRPQSQFQSLFLWNDLFNTDTIPVTSGSGFCFNPCFYGTTSSTPLDYGCPHILNPVS